MKVVDGLPDADHAAVDFMLKLAKPQSSVEKRVVYDFKRALKFRRKGSILFAVADECIPKVTMWKRRK